MESFPLHVSALGGKDVQQMITLVETPDSDGITLDERASPPLVHVLEAGQYGNNLTSNGLEVLPGPPDPLKSPHCLICYAKLGVSGRGSVNIFSQQIKTTTRNLDLDVILGSILMEKFSSEVPSNIICKKCLRVVDDIDALEDQIFSMKQDVINKYTKSQSLFKHEHNGIFLDDNFDPEGIASVSKDDRDYRMYQTKKVRQKRRKRGRGRPPSYVELEVKEEGNGSSPTFELSHSSEILQSDANAFQDLFVQVYNNEGNEMLEIEGEEDCILVDGLDIGREEAEFMLPIYVLDPINIDENHKEIISTDPLNFQPKIRCRYCLVKIERFPDIEKHLLEFHSDRLYECEICGKQSSSRPELLEHLEEHIRSGITPYTCNNCDQQFSLPRQLREHSSTHKGKTCFQCNKRFLSDADLQVHVDSHANAKPFACEKCNKRFSTKHILKVHMRTHGVRPRPHKCKICHKNFLTTYHLQEHTLIHKERKEFICVTCGKAFGTNRSLEMHAVTHTGVKNYACRICSKAFARKGEVEDHERIHTGERPFQCEFCGATFSQRSNLLSHKKATHFEEKRYQCSECPKAFKRRRLLVYHIMSVHTGERPYKCHICSAAFVYPEHYKKHLRIHSGDKPFKCEICGKAFNSRDNKNAHKFIHSDKKQYECIICSTGFMRKPLMANHILQHQQNGNIPESANFGDYVKVNPPSIIDNELIENVQSSSVSMKVNTEIGISPNLDSDEPELMSRPLQLIDSDDIPKYIIHTGDKSDENVGHFLASLQAQVVEVRTEDLEHYTELTPEQLSQMAHVAAHVVSNSGGQNSDSVLLQVEDEKTKDGLSVDISRDQTILQLDHKDNPNVMESQRHFIKNIKKVNLANSRQMRYIPSSNEFESN